MSHHAAAVLRAAEVQTFAEHCSCLRLLRLDPQQITSPDVGKSFRPVWGLRVPGLVMHAAPWVQPWLQLVEFRKRRWPLFSGAMTHLK